MTSFKVGDVVKLKEGCGVSTSGPEWNLPENSEWEIGDAGGASIRFFGLPLRYDTSRFELALENKQKYLAVVYDCFDTKTFVSEDEQTLEDFLGEVKFQFGHNTKFTVYSLKKVKEYRVTQRTEIIVEEVGK